MASSIVLSDNGVTSGSAGIKSTGGNDGVLLLQTTTSGGAATTAVTVDNAQNVGVGVTPSAWTSGYKGLDISTVGAIASNSSSFTSYNNFYSGTNSTYKTTGFATAYRQGQDNGQHAWFVAPSGTAGTTVSFTQAMTLDASGNLAVTSVANPGYGIYVNRNLASTYALGLQNSTNNTGNNFVVFINYLGNTAGAISQNAIATVNYGTASDYRLKENITPMVGALDKVAQLKPITYKWKDSGEESQGFIAHELQSVLSDCVVGEKDATKQEQYEITPAVKDEQGNIFIPAEMGTRTVPVYQMVDTSFLVATLTAAIQEQQALIQSLTDRLTALEGAAK